MCQLVSKLDTFCILMCQVYVIGVKIKVGILGIGGVY